MIADEGRAGGVAARARVPRSTWSSGRGHRAVSWFGLMGICGIYGLFGVVVLSATACATDDKREAGQVMRAIEELRLAPNGKKGPLVGALGRLTCTHPAVCSARDRCADAYGHLARGVETERKVRGVIAGLERNPPKDTQRISELNAALDRAEAELDQAQAALPACEEAVAVLRRKFAL